MMNGGDLCELAKILGHSNIEMTESVTLLGSRAHHEDQQHCEGDLDSDEKEAGANAGRGRSKTLRVSESGRVLVDATKTLTFW